MTKASSTKKENYQQRVHGPPGSTSGEAETESGWAIGQELSNLFLDTGRLAAGLDIKYVWIDSICIVQEDATDWENEATEMAGYYQNAWLTVAATKTVDEGGFLHQAAMDPCSIPRISRLPYRNREGRQEGHFYLQGLPDSTIRQEYEDNITNSNLLDRGWIFQEWMLSPRILCFSTLMPFLVCGGLPPLPIAGTVMTNHEIDSSQEQQEFSTIKDHFLYKAHDVSEQAYKHRLGLNLTASRAAVFETWRKLITIYSSLQLTKLENDRLVALAGIAREFGSALSSKPIEQPGEVEADRQAKYSNMYACGLWLGDIVRELQWERFDSLKKPSCRARCFPTWSWLSLASPTTDEIGQPTLGGARVQWPSFEVYSKSLKISGRTVSECRRMPDPVRCVYLKSAFIIPIGAESDGWPINLSQSDNWRMLESSGSNNEYGNSNRFIGLCFEQAKSITVKLGPRFDSEKHSSIAAKCTHHESDVQRDHWRVVTLPTSGNRGAVTQEIIHGWASLEHPDYEYPGKEPKEDHVLALRIAHLPEVDGMGSWFISNTDTAAIVIYIRQVRGAETGDRAYFERLGVGRLFGSEIVSDFAAAEEGEIWLI